jgi:hypothetical protein
MKKTLAFLLILNIAITSLTGCNIPNDNTPNNKKDNVVTTESEISEESSIGVNTQEEAFDGIDIAIISLKDLAQLRELLYCTDKERIENPLFQSGGYKTEDLLIFFDTVDHTPFIRTIDGEITWINYVENVSATYKTLQITTTTENGDWVQLLYYFGADQAKDPLAFATETCIIRGGSLFAEHMSTKDNRVSIISELKIKADSYEGDYIEWWGTIDEIPIRISTNITTMSVDDLLEYITISSIAEMDTVSHELIEQISEDMTYKEVKDILGTVGANTGSDSIVLKYYISDGRIAYIEFKENGASELNEFVVESIKVEKVE